MAFSDKPSAVACRKWRAANPEKQNAICRAHYEKNKEWANARRRARYAANREQEIQRRIQWGRDNRFRDEENRLRRKVGKQRGGHTESEWQAVLKKHGGRCAHCKTTAKLTRDHIIPISRGGTNYAFNLQPLCRSCNSRKNARLPENAQHSLFDSVAA